MRFDCAGSHNIIVRNIIITTSIIIIINFILHYLPTPPTLFGVSCRDNFTCLSSSPAFSLLGSWNAQVRKCIYIYFLQGWFMMILHPKGMDTICQVPGPKSVRILGGGGPHLEISSSNIVPRQTSRPKLLIYEINVKSMWNQCEYLFDLSSRQFRCTRNVFRNDSERPRKWCAQCNHRATLEAMWRSELFYRSQHICNLMDYQGFIYIYI